MRHRDFTIFWNHGAITGLFLLLFAVLLGASIHLSASYDNQPGRPESLCEISNLDFINVLEGEIPNCHSLTQEHPDKNKKKPCSLFKQYNTFWICASKSAGCEIHNFDNSHVNRIPSSEHLCQLLSRAAFPSPVRAGPLA